MIGFPTGVKQFALLAILCLAVLAPLAPAGPTTAPALELNDGDRIAFVGNTFVEREQKADYIETMLISRFPGKNITFRNLGYSADTATGAARGLCAGWTQFEGADKAFERLRKLVAEFKPTVLLINYGMTESFYGPEELPTFVASYNKMLDALTAAAGTSPRLVLMSPNYHENLGKPLPDPSAHNVQLQLYAGAIADIAAKRQALYLDVYDFTKSGAPFKLTFNGIHLTQFGYWWTAAKLEEPLFGAQRQWYIHISADGKVAGAAGGKVTEAKVADGVLTFTVIDDRLPLSPLPPDAPAAIQSCPTVCGVGVRLLSVSGLKPGTYELKSGEKVVAKGTAELWGAGAEIVGDPEIERAEALRHLVIAKDFDYFNYQRPDNDSYIFAFRKREQGRNAVEIPQFLPLVEEKEKQIAVFRVPKPVTYELLLVK